MGDPLHDKESEQFVARYIERAPLSLEKLFIQDNSVAYGTKDGTAHEFDALEFLAELSCHIPKTYESIEIIGTGLLLIHQPRKTLQK